MKKFSADVYYSVHYRDGAKDSQFLELNTGEVLVETAGYMSAEQQVRRLVAAGTVYQYWKNSHFPPDEEVPDDFYPPDYSPSELDLIDEARLIVAGKTAAAARAAVAERSVSEDGLDPDPDPVSDGDEAAA